MRHQKKTYSSPKKAWEKKRIQSEKWLVSEYGLKNKKELWKMEEVVRNIRRQARELIAEQDKDKEKLLLGKLGKMGLISEKANLDDVLKLGIRSIMDRRLQTIAFRKGFAKTVNESRQKIVHGHILINGSRMTVPSYFVLPSEENTIDVTIFEAGAKPVEKIKEEVIANAE